MKTLGVVLLCISISVLAALLRETRRSVYWTVALLCAVAVVMLGAYLRGYGFHGPVRWIPHAQGLLWAAMPTILAFAVARLPFESMWQTVRFAAASWLLALFIGFLIFVAVWGI